jgi:DNA-binding NarL/FixJ family response regulator
MRIILADHHPQALLTLKLTLQEKPGFEVTGEAINADDLLALVACNPPDLALIDWELPGRSIDGLISELHACVPRPIVVVMGNKPEYGRMALKASADAFVTKGDQHDWLLETLQKFNKKPKIKKTG